MQREQNMEQNEQDQVETLAAYQCNLCSRRFPTNHGKNVHMGTCRKRFLDTHSIQSIPAQETQDHVAINVNKTAENHPTSHPSRSIWG